MLGKKKEVMNAVSGNVTQQHANKSDVATWSSNLAKGGYDFGSVGLCICLFVSNITQNHQIAMKFYGRVRGNTIKN